MYYNQDLVTVRRDSVRPGEGPGSNPPCAVAVCDAVMGEALLKESLPFVHPPLSQVFSHFFQ